MIKLLARWSALLGVEPWVVLWIGLVLAVATGTIVYQLVFV